MFRRSSSGAIAAKELVRKVHKMAQVVQQETNPQCCWRTFLFIHLVTIHLIRLSSPVYKLVLSTSLNTILYYSVTDVWACISEYYRCSLYQVIRTWYQSLRSFDVCLWSWSLLVGILLSVFLFCNGTVFSISSILLFLISSLISFVSSLIPLRHSETCSTRVV